jgi:predicted NBD/HSP70 family sugar kinase
VDDGVRCLALAERRYGLARILANFLFLYIGRGVGAAIVLGNRFYRGSNGLAGEFGHITVSSDGPLCNCGNRGCLEALVSQTAILSSVRSMVASNVYTGLATRARVGCELSLRDIEEAAEGGDKLANMVVHGVGESIGTGVADLVNIFDPGVVILGGEVINHFGDHLIEGINRTVRLRGIHSITQRTRILASRLGAPAVEPDITADEAAGPGACSPAARGAATMLIERYLGCDILNL